MRRAVVLIDGEHYPEVVQSALEELSAQYDFRGAVFLGGTEKIKTDDLAGEAEALFGLPVVVAEDYVAGLGQALSRFEPEVVVDASDEPVLDYRRRFRLISHTLAGGVPYEGADFRFTPPRLDPWDGGPSLSIIGTAKRVGKTAVSGFVARQLRGRFGGDAGVGEAGNGRGGVLIVAMGRGGPTEPEVIEGVDRALSAADLLGWSREGRHAASDHFEDAVLSRVTTVGCRRCGGGMAGEPLVSNVAQGAAVAAGLRPALTIFEGSGSVIPPIATDARLLVTGAHQPRAYIDDYLGTYRVLLSDLVVLAMAEEPMASAEHVGRVTAAIREIKPELAVVPVVFRPAPMEPVEGTRAAVFTTAPSFQEDVIRRHLEERYGCRVCSFSGALSDRRTLREHLRAAAEANPDVFLTEIKAAAIDVVAEEADRQGRRIVFLDNHPVEVQPARPGDLEEHAVRLGLLAKERFERGHGNG